MSQTELTGSTAYIAAYEGIAFYKVPNPGYLRFSGETRVDYLQRQTTNDLGLLSPTRGVPSILTSATGRVLEVFTLIQDGDAIGMLTQPSHGPGLAEYFKKRIFFNDKVSIEDLSPKFAQIELHGPQAGTILKQFGAAIIPGIDAITSAEFQGETFSIMSQAGFTSEFRFTLVLSSQLIDQLIDRLIDLPQLDQPTRELLRIEAGQPGDPEFAGASYTPFELGLDNYVSTEKGCYTGQEVLARQVTYDKIVRNLVRIRSQEPAAAGSKVHDESKEIGVITSAAVSPMMGPITLAVVRKPFDKLDTRVEIATDKGKIAATIG